MESGHLEGKGNLLRREERLPLEMEMNTQPFRVMVGRTLRLPSTLYGGVVLAFSGDV